MAHTADSATLADSVPGPDTPAGTPSRIEGERRRPTNEEDVDHVVVANLDAAYRLARWLVRNEHDAEDVVQEACLRAIRYFHTFAGGNGRAWFLRIVRHVCWKSTGHGPPVPTDAFDEEVHQGSEPAANPEVRLMQIDDVTMIRRAISSLPDRFRELLVLRELEGLSYQEVADVIGIPVGTVMSGLSRARQRFRVALTDGAGLSPGPDRIESGRRYV
jgi:RNA polymerase sigma-70 factor, ECF subfamily